MLIYIILFVVYIYIYIMYEVRTLVLIYTVRRLNDVSFGRARFNHHQQSEMMMGYYCSIVYRPRHTMVHSLFNPIYTRCFIIEI